jgi:CheY-like chemotaxis protein
MIAHYSLLITDDDAGFRETLRSVFEPRGFRTLLAGDGEEALRIVEHEDIHLVLLDMHMPRLTGLETLERVKRFKSRLPCILMSAAADEELVRQAMLAQAFAVLHKPVSQGKVTSTVLLALERTYNWSADQRSANDPLHGTPEQRHGRHHDDRRN